MGTWRRPWSALLTVCIDLQSRRPGLGVSVARLLRGRVLMTTAGSITQWGEVSKTKKDRSRSKAKDVTVTTFGDSTKEGRVARSSRTGAEGGRGRSRGADRGRGGRGRGASTTHTNGSRKDNVEPSIPTTESTAWGSASISEEQSAGDAWGPTATDTTSTTKVASSIIPDGVKKSWASMFTAPAPIPKKVVAPAEK